MSYQRGQLAALFVALLLAGTACVNRSESGASSEASGSEDSLPPPEITEVWEPEPQMVRSDGEGTPSSDAVVLFDGTDLTGWTHEDGGAAGWRVENGVMTVVPGTGSIISRQGLGDIQLHIEWRSPAEIEGDGQGRGNSGIYFMKRYEVQVLDSYDNRTYSNGQAGAIYKQHIPLVNASRPPGVWQSYDVVFTAPRFGVDGELVSPAYMTVFHNGVLIQNHVELRGPTVWRGEPEYEAHAERVPLLLQDHGNPVSYRNIWVRELAGGF